MGTRWESEYGNAVWGVWEHGMGGMGGTEGWKYGEHFEKTVWYGGGTGAWGGFEEGTGGHGDTVWEGTEVWGGKVRE